MKENKNLKLAIVFSSILIFVGTTMIFLKNQIPKLIDYCYKIKGFKINNISKKNINIDISVVFKNISKIKYYLEYVILDVYIMGFYIGKTKIDINKEIMPNNTTEFLANINYDLPKIKLDINTIEKISNIVATFLKNKQDLEITLKMELKFKVLNIPVLLPLNLTYKLPELTESTPTNCKIEN